MGGQACILYGAAEFSRDVDLAVLADPKNLDRLEKALIELQAEPFFFPPMTAAMLLKGHACHFRCHLPDLEELRIDVMAVMNNCDRFPFLWKRRRRLPLPGVGLVDVLSLPDLVKAKKTQRDKDWPMIRRLIEVDYYSRPKRLSSKRIAWWLLEARSPDILVEVCHRYSRQANKLIGLRPLLSWAAAGLVAKLETALHEEEERFRQADRRYWQPLREKLFQMRQALRKLS